MTSTNGPSQLPVMLKQHGSDILVEWVQQQIKNTQRRGLIKEAELQEQSREFLAAFTKLYPQASRAAMVDAYLFMVGALVMTMAAGDRAMRLDDERQALSPAGLAELLLARLTRFCAAGIERLLTE